MAEHEHVPGEFPEVRDEAPPTPAWLPLLGLGLLAVLTLFVVYRSATAPDEPEGAAVVGQIGDTPPTEAAPAEGQPAAAPDIVPVPSARIAPAAQPAQPAAQPAQPAQPAAQPAQPGGGGPDSFGRMPGDEHYGHAHE